VVIDLRRQLGEQWAWADHERDLIAIHRDIAKREREAELWFIVAVSAADLAGTETDRSQRLGSVSDDTHKTLHRKLKKF